MFQLCKRCTSFWIPIPSGWEGQILWHMVLLVPFSTCLCRQRRAPSTVTQSLTGVMSLSYFAGGIFEPRPRALLGWWLKPSAKWLRCAWPRVSGTKCSCGSVQGSCTVPLGIERRDEVINEVIDQTCNMPKLLTTSHHSGWAYGQTFSMHQKYVSKVKATAHRMFWYVLMFPWVQSPGWVDRSVFALFLEANRRQCLSFRQWWCFEQRGDTKGWKLGWSHSNQSQSGGDKVGGGTEIVGCL